MTHKIVIATLAVIVGLSFGTTVALASEVTGTLSSSGVATQSGSNGTISGTVSPASGGGGGGGGGGPANGPVFPQTGSTVTGTAGTGQGGTVLGASAGAPGVPSTGNAGSEVNGGNQITMAESPISTPNNQLGAVLGADTGFGMWLWILPLLLILAVAGYFIYRHYKNKQEMDEMEGTV